MPGGCLSLGLSLCCCDAASLTAPVEGEEQKSQISTARWDLEKVHGWSNKEQNGSLGSSAELVLPFLWRLRDRIEQSILFPFCFYYRDTELRTLSSVYVSLPAT